MNALLSGMVGFDASSSLGLPDEFGFMWVIAAAVMFAWAALVLPAESKRQVVRVRLDDQK